MNVTQDMLDAAAQAFDDTYDVESFPTGLSDNKHAALKAAIEAALSEIPLPAMKDLSQHDGDKKCQDDWESYGRDLGWNACLAAIAVQRKGES